MNQRTKRKKYTVYLPRDQETNPWIQIAIFVKEKSKMKNASKRTAISYKRNK